MDIHFRTLQTEDIHILELLNQLTTVGSISENEFIKQYSKIFQNPHHHVLVGTVVTNGTEKIICCGTLLVELKFIHRCSSVGHIEDIVVDESYRGLGIGKQLIKELINTARNEGCYKCLADCGNHNIGFYEKCGMNVHGNEMACYFD
eukprot:TRINITY_DN4492_c0_g1_i1.p1 TRINITY_DN4492_c0_g1~~TRINITY_DN4492_c0_g1_i1.p1  ORF type:complete len:147 (+),score=41.11 TRINITY_DN4492_c0_g1_i1:145-585(+)